MMIHISYLNPPSLLSYKKKYPINTLNYLINSNFFLRDLQYFIISSFTPTIRDLGGSQCQSTAGCVSDF